MKKAQNVNNFFWNKFYNKNNQIIEKPSSFSRFIFKYLKKIHKKKSNYNYLTVGLNEHILLAKHQLVF